MPVGRAISRGVGKSVSEQKSQYPEVEDEQIDSDLSADVAVAGAEDETEAAAAAPAEAEVGEVDVTDEKQKG